MFCEKRVPTLKLWAKGVADYHLVVPLEVTHKEEEEENENGRQGSRSLRERPQRRPTYRRGHTHTIRPATANHRTLDKASSNRPRPPTQSQDKTGSRARHCRKDEGQEQGEGQVCLTSTIPMHCPHLYSSEPSILK